MMNQMKHVIGGMRDLEKLGILLGVVLKRVQELVGTENTITVLRHAEKRLQEREAERGPF